MEWKWNISHQLINKILLLNSNAESRHNTTDGFLSRQIQMITPSPKEKKKKYSYPMKSFLLLLFLLGFNWQPQWQSRCISHWLIKVPDRNTNRSPQYFAILRLQWNFYLFVRHLLSWIKNVCAVIKNRSRMPRNKRKKKKYNLAVAVPVHLRNRDKNASRFIPTIFLFIFNLRWAPFVLDTLLAHMKIR